MTEAETFDRLEKAARGLPEVEAAIWYGTPSLQVRGKSFCRVKEAGVAVLLVSLEEKELLLQVAPEIYFETDHYRGWPAMLVRMEAISDAELEQRMSKAWFQKAPRRLARCHREGASPRRLNPLALTYVAFMP